MGQDDPDTAPQPVVTPDEPPEPDDSTEPDQEARSGWRRTRLLVAGLLLVIAAAGGALLGLYASSPDERPRPVTTLAPNPPTTAPTSTETIPVTPSAPTTSSPP